MIFPRSEDAKLHNGEIIECSWDAKQEAWTYMRDRRDKKTPNAWHVYEKVLQSIKDNITPNDLVGIIQEATCGNIIYAASSKSKGLAPSSERSDKGNGTSTHPNANSSGPSTQPNSCASSTQPNGSAPSNAAVAQ